MKMTFISINVRRRQNLAAKACHVALDLAFTEGAGHMMIPTNLTNALELGAGVTRTSLVVMAIV